jgi:hypothetical protein
MTNYQSFIARFGLAIFLIVIAGCHAEQDSPTLAPADSAQQQQPEAVPSEPAPSPKVPETKLPKSG